MKPAFRIFVQEPGKAKVTDITAWAAERLISLRAVDAAGYTSDRFDLALDYRRGRTGGYVGLPPSHRSIWLSLGYEPKPIEIGFYIVDRLSLMLDRGDTTTLMGYAPYAMTIDALHVQAGAGGGTVSLSIDGVEITGLTGVAVGTTRASHAASAANAVPQGGKLAFVVATSADLEDLHADVVGTRT